MGQLKQATTILMLASVLLLIASAWPIIEIVYNAVAYGYNYYEIIEFIGPVMGIAASLLLIIGFMMLRDTKK